MENKCSVESCNNTSQRRGFCLNHYSRFLKKGIIPKIIGNKKCLINGCLEKHYAKNYCRNHYSNFLLNGNPLKKTYDNSGKCLAPDCPSKAEARGYCGKHYTRLKKHGDVNYKGSPKGSINGNYKGGVSEYMNHYDFKKNRIFKMQETKGRCEICGREGFEVHHKDETKENHNLENLILLCKKCHLMAHTGRRNKTSKFRRQYGMSLAELAEKYGGSETRIFQLHRRGVLKEFIESEINKKML